MNKMYLYNQMCILLSGYILISFATTCTMARNHCMKRLVNGIIRCCTGFVWNNTLQDCIACPLGYVGLQCEIPCIYPLYGLECQSFCNCPREFCLISTGCIRRSTPIENYKESGYTNRWIGSTTLDSIYKLTGGSSESFSTNGFSHTSERNSFTDSDHLSPTPKQDSFPSVIILVSMGCLILIILCLTLFVCLLYKKHNQLRKYIEENRYLSCALKPTKDSDNKAGDGEIKIALTIFQNKRDSVIHLEPHSLSQLSNQNVSHYSYALPSRMNPENPGTNASLSSMASGAYVIPNDRCSNKAGSSNEGDSNVYLTVLND